MTKIEIAKKIATTIVTIGTGKITSTIIRNNVPLNTITDKVTVVAAGLVIGSMAGDATSEYTDRKIDEAVAWYHENVK